MEKRALPSPVLFLALAFSLPLLFAVLRTRAEDGTLRLLLYGLQAAGPSLAALAAAARGGELVPFLARQLRARGALAACLIPFAAALAAMAAARGLSCALTGEAFAVRGVTPAQGLVILWALAAEELGWRGYLHPLLRASMGRPALAPLAVGLIWGLWHYHYVLFDGMRVPLVWFFLGCVAESCLYGYFLDRSGGNLLSAMSYHCSWNLFVHVFAIQPADNGGDPLPYVILMVLELLAACLVLAAGRPRGAPPSVYSPFTEN